MSAGYTSRTAQLALRRFDDVDAFEAVAQPFLLRQEATNCLQLGLIGGIRLGEWTDPYLAVVERKGMPALVAMRTPPHNLLLSHTDDLSSIAPVIDGLSDAPGGVLGPNEVADAFARAWSESRGVKAELGLRQRIYRLERVEPVSGVPGGPRGASAGDRERLEEWMAAFLSEALPGKRADAATTVARWLGSAERELWFWEVNGEPVSLAGAGSRTSNGVRISAVYTPVDKRGRGFASALVASLSQRQLDLGRKFCFLFTDLANPTSNHIYRNLGYRPVSDAHEYDFISD